MNDDYKILDNDTKAEETLAEENNSEKQTEQINQEQSQPISGNVSVPSPIVSPQVSTTPVTSTMSTVSFINMISNKQLSVG